MVSSPLSLRDGGRRFAVVIDTITAAIGMATTVSIGLFGYLKWRLALKDTTPEQRRAIIAALRPPFHLELFGRSARRSRLPPSKQCSQRGADESGRAKT